MLLGLQVDLQFFPMFGLKVTTGHSTMVPHDALVMDVSEVFGNARFPLGLICAVGFRAFVPLHTLVMNVG